MSLGNSSADNQNTDKVTQDLQAFMMKAIVRVGKDMEWRCEAAGLSPGDYWAICISSLLRVSAAVIAEKVNPRLQDELLRVFREMIKVRCRPDD